MGQGSNQTNRNGRGQPFVQSLPVGHPQAGRTASVGRAGVMLRWMGWSFVFTLVIIVSATLGAIVAVITPFNVSQTPAEQDGSVGELFRRGFQYGISRPVNILVMGIDRVPDAAERSPEIFSGRSDTMLLVRLNPDDHHVNILSIPRDTQVEIPGLGVEKINYANVEGGANLALQVVSQTLNNVPIDRYVRVSTGAFRELVDVLGGVEVYVPKAMFYEDKTQGLKIDLQPGQQTLDGEQAEGFARFRQDELGDIGRAQRQQALLKALQQKLSNPLTLTRLPKVFSVLQKHIDSNLSVGEMLAIVQFTLQLDRSDLQMVLLPGRFSAPEEYIASYWIADQTGLDRVMRNYFQVPLEEELDAVTADIPSAQNLSIAVQNASGDPEAGQSVVDFLAQQGFYNVFVDQDWPQIESETEVVVQRGDLEAAKGLHLTLGIGDVLVDSTGNIDSDLTIRVGQDWLRH